MRQSKLKKREQKIAEKFVMSPECAEGHCLRYPRDTSRGKCTCMCGHGDQT